MKNSLKNPNQLLHFGQVPGSNYFSPYFLNSALNSQNLLENGPNWLINSPSSCSSPISPNSTSICPICHKSLQGIDIKQHFNEEVQKFETLIKTNETEEKFKFLDNVEIDVESSNDEQSFLRHLRQRNSRFISRYQTYLRVKQNRETRKIKTYQSQKRFFEDREKSPILNNSPISNLNELSSNQLNYHFRFLHNNLLLQQQQHLSSPLLSNGFVTSSVNRNSPANISLSNLISTNQQQTNTNNQTGGVKTMNFTFNNVPNSLNVNNSFLNNSNNLNTSSNSNAVLSSLNIDSLNNANLNNLSNSSNNLTTSNNLNELLFSQHNSSSLYSLNRLSNFPVNLNKLNSLAHSLVNSIASQKVSSVNPLHQLDAQLNNSNNSIDCKTTRATGLDEDEDQISETGDNIDLSRNENPTNEISGSGINLNNSSINSNTNGRHTSSPLNECNSVNITSANGSTHSNASSPVTKTPPTPVNAIWSIESITARNEVKRDNT